MQLQLPQKCCGIEIDPESFISVLIVLNSNRISL